MGKRPSTPEWLPTTYGREMRNCDRYENDVPIHLEHPNSTIFNDDDNISSILSFYPIWVPGFIDEIPSHQQPPNVSILCGPFHSLFREFVASLPLRK